MLLHFEIHSHLNYTFRSCTCQDLAGFIRLCYIWLQFGYLYQQEPTYNQAVPRGSERIYQNTMSFEFVKKLPTPAEIREQLPLPEELAKIKEARDAEIRDVLTGKSSKFLVIIGPCSADNESLQYPCRKVRYYRN